MGSVWTVKGGSHGEWEDRMLERGYLGLNGEYWTDLPNLEDVESREELATLFRQMYPEKAEKSAATYVAQLWSLLRRMDQGDLVVLPLKTTGTIAVGRIAGSYAYVTHLGQDVRHTRPVEWIATDVPRDAFDQDLLYSFGAFLTFGRVRREEAETRVLAALEERSRGQRRPTADVDVPDVTEEPDIEVLAREQVRQHISRNFAGHALAQLVAAILEAQGFSSVSPSEPGPDGGVDILAGSGVLGLDSPRLVVQVKTGQAGVDEFRALRGVVESFRADQGLLVAWRGFKGKVRQEARQSYFAARLWDAEDLLDELFSIYGELPDDLRSQLPLQRLWALVPSE